MKKRTEAWFNRASLGTLLQEALSAGLEDAEPLKGVYAKIMLASVKKDGITLTSDEVRILSLDWAVSEAATQGAREVLLAGE